MKYRIDDVKVQVVGIEHRVYKFENDGVQKTVECTYLNVMYKSDRENVNGYSVGSYKLNKNVDVEIKMADYYAQLITQFDENNKPHTEIASLKPVVVVK